MATLQGPQNFQSHYAEFDNPKFGIHGRTLFFTIILLFIILIATLLLIYARWVCRSQSHLPLTSRNSVQSTQTLPAPSQGLDPDSIKKLQIILHQIPSDPNCGFVETECCICLDDFKDDEKLKILPGCGHCFHCDCVDRWLPNHCSCPLYRASLLVDHSELF
ncbi:RING-H2 finger protein [Quillaja saponaria]|uniref:RING-H2 finger protein n=1 Tax=Quillaja saponaria TaxID=32244 RepID=A0AAD7PLS1_QUISA|nr:RING-H2 finger protein [Quillaja saponaria]